MHWFGIIFGVIVLLAGVYLAITESNAAFLVIGLGLIIIVGPFVLSSVIETKVEKEKEEMFIEFTRSLVESVNAGIPIIKSIMNVKDKPFGTLSPHVKKLANQVSLGIPLNIAFKNFSRDVNNVTISRAVTLIGEAERAGGEIGTILESVATSVSEIDKLKKERRAAIYNLVVQGYIIFFVFIGIILIMQFKIIPLTQNLGNINTVGSVSGVSVGGGQVQDITFIFFYLLLAQGFFTGLFVGKLTEGTLKAGIKHSFILVLIGFMFAAGAQLFV